MQNIRLKSTVPSLLLLISLFLLTNVGSGQQGILKAAGSKLQKANSDFYTIDPETYYGTVKFEMKDGSYVTPFGVDVIIKDGENVVKSVSTNNSGRYYLKDMETGRYQMIVKYKNSTVFTDSLNITSSTPNKLKEIVIKIKNQ